jgi:hypothetical protein
MINICHHDTVGLQNDYKILKESLKNFKTNEISYPEIAYVRNYKVKLETVEMNIFLEHIYANIIQYAKHNVFIPNLEWLNKYDESLIDKIDMILCKTKQGYEILSKKYQNKVKYIGFTSLNRDISQICPMYNKCVHVKGISKYKNTQMLLDLYMKHPEWPVLYIVNYGIENTNGYIRIDTPVKIKENIILYQNFLDEESLKKLMNLCGIHLCCSFSEGFGHYINEGRSVGAAVVTTDGAPMNEMVNELLISYDEEVSIMNGYGYKIDAEIMEKQLGKIFEKSQEEMESIGKMNKEQYKISTKKFQEKINSIVESILA